MYSVLVQRKECQECQWLPNSLSAFGLSASRPYLQCTSTDCSYARHYAKTPWNAPAIARDTCHGKPSLTCNNRKVRLGCLFRSRVRLPLDSRRRERQGSGHKGKGQHRSCPDRRVEGRSRRKLCARIAESGSQSHVWKTSPKCVSGNSYAR
jgi:hypothetical protein